MLRALVAVLLLANLAFWAWSAGALESLGMAPARERDPARLALQMGAESVRLLPPGSAMTAASSPRAASAAGSGSAADAEARGLPSQCLETGPLATAALASAERALLAGGLAEGSWVRRSQDMPAQYAVVLGPFFSNESLRNKREEIARLRLPLEAVNLPAAAPATAAQPGLALGRYDNRAAAESALAGYNQRGVRTARVVELRPASSETQLRLDDATPAQAQQLRALSVELAGAAFAPCAPGAPGAPGLPAAR